MERNRSRSSSHERSTSRQGRERRPEKRRKSRSSSSSGASPSPQKTNVSSKKSTSADQKTEKKKQKRRSVSSSSSSSSSSTSSSNEEAKKKKRKEKKAKKRLKKMKAKEKKKEKKEKKRMKRMKKLAPTAEKTVCEAPLMITAPLSVKVEKPQSGLETWQNDTAEHGPVMTDEQKASFSMKRPMTKEEYEARQSVIRRVTDPATGRTRLIRGDGEVLEEIVSKERHREINKQATKGDGFAFQKRLGTNR